MERGARVLVLRSMERAKRVLKTLKRAKLMLLAESAGKGRGKERTGKSLVLLVTIRSRPLLGNWVGSPLMRTSSVEFWTRVSRCWRDRVGKLGKGVVFLARRSTF